MDILKKLIDRMLPKKRVPVRVPIKETYDDIQIDCYLLGFLDCE